MTNEEFTSISEILDKVVRPSRWPLVFVCVSQLLFLVAFVCHVLGVF